MELQWNTNSHKWNTNEAKWEFKVTEGLHDYATYGLMIHVVLANSNNKTHTRYRSPHGWVLLSLTSSQSIIHTDAPVGASNSAREIYQEYTKQLQKRKLESQTNDVAYIIMCWMRQNKIECSMNLDFGIKLDVLGFCAVWRSLIGKMIYLKHDVFYYIVPRKCQEPNDLTNKELYIYIYICTYIMFFWNSAIHIAF